MNWVIQGQNLSKQYGQKNVLDGIDLTIAPGRIVGLIGPNGAGKTTLLKGILGLTPIEGELRVLGYNPYRQRTAMLEKVSFIADTAILPRWLKVSEALTYVEGVHPKFNRSKALDFLAKTQIQPAQTIQNLSKGMITQLHLALIMAIDSQLLVLDEPTLGLDILYRKQFYESLLNDYYDAQKTLLITTHQVEEIEGMLTDILFINQGKITLNSPMEDLPKRFAILQAEPDKVETAKALNPIYSRSLLGSDYLLFENPDFAALTSLGRLSTPSLADVFVAKMQNCH
ncbi:MAG TPA: ABC transporter ATP-binding protein [Cellvibrionaceae bacterium]|nr:ABC transporter ATP-binding protein [Cellvibrionaceae bacterium]HMW72454.1 ABC transporter ATP-binding protein [Cellvibrionaceae bacterium]HMY39775.1 ABC transporter ATP-binding protein [Marinagarivorans sp.]HNG60223.1 ABC transporter ATP-binding protein [Cellvibrionaceae bacterium]